MLSPRAKTLSIYSNGQSVITDHNTASLLESSGKRTAHTSRYGSVGLNLDFQKLYQFLEQEQIALLDRKNKNKTKADLRTESFEFVQKLCSSSLQKQNIFSLTLAKAISNPVHFNKPQ